MLHPLPFYDKEKELWTKETLDIGCGNGPLTSIKIL
jgi:16S rRNA G1207 methylase RsmC